MSRHIWKYKDIVHENEMTTERSPYKVTVRWLDSEQRGQMTRNTRDYAMKLVDAGEANLVIACLRDTLATTADLLQRVMDRIEDNAKRRETEE